MYSFFNIYFPVVDNGYFASEVLSIDQTYLTHTRLGGLLPDRSYRITIYARNGRGRGQPYELEDKTLPGGRKSYAP